MYLSDSPALIDTVSTPSRIVRHDVILAPYTGSVLDIGGYVKFIILGKSEYINYATKVIEC